MSEAAISLCFVEAEHPPAEIGVFRSRDHGKSWQKQDVVFSPDSNGNLPSMHMNEHGITLRHGKHKGRLVRPTRWYAGKNDRSLWPEHYTNAIYSDDGGRTWNTSDPFPENGTGEAAVVELSDGRIYYNSRVHWQERPMNTRRRDAISTDGGKTWTSWRIVEVLPDGPQDTNYGCMGGLTRLPVVGRDVLIYSNCDSPKGRNHGTVWASFDGGKTWPHQATGLRWKLRVFFDDVWTAWNQNAGPDLHSLRRRTGRRLDDRKIHLSWVLGGEQTATEKSPIGSGSAPWSRVEPFVSSQRLLGNRHP